MSDADHYQKGYGIGYNSVPPNFDLCCVSVRETGTNWPRYHQCSRKRGFGPDGAYCKQHDPEVVKKRQVEIDAREKAKWRDRMIEVHGKRFLSTLEKIADGHNDPRQLALEAIKHFRDGTY